MKKKLYCITALTDCKTVLTDCNIYYLTARLH